MAFTKGARAIELWNDGVPSQHVTV